MKRFVLILVGLLIIPTSAWADFSDVPETHEHYAAVLWLEGRGVIEGYSDGTFKPEQEVNRAEALKIIMLGNGITISGEATASISYTDVDSEDWFSDYVMQATQQGWVEGYSDGTFRGDQTVNLAEALKMIMLVSEIETSTPTEAPYEDVAAEVWFASYVAYAKDRNLISADTDGLLHPDRSLTRGELAEMIYRLSYIETYELEEFPISLNWPEYQHDTEDFAFKAPFEWEVISGSNGEIVLWHADGAYDTTYWGHTYPNSARVVLTLDANAEGWSTGSYFSNIQSSLSGYEGASMLTTTAGAENYTALRVTYEGGYEMISDVYASLPNGSFLVAQGVYGKGALQDQLTQEIEAIFETLRYSEATGVSSSDDVESVLEEARANIQVDGAGQAVLDLFPDLELIETDTIGVGTGPVDYYYSAWANVTLKYERSFDVILDIEEGETTAF